MQHCCYEMIPILYRKVTETINILPLHWSTTHLTCHLNSLLLSGLFNGELKSHKYKDNCLQMETLGSIPESLLDTLEVSACFEPHGMKLLFFLAVTLSPALFLTLKITPTVHYLKFLKQLFSFIPLFQIIHFLMRNFQLLSSI